VTANSHGWPHLPLKTVAGKGQRYRSAFTFREIKVTRHSRGAALASVFSASAFWGRFSRISDRLCCLPTFDEAVEAAFGILGARASGKC
jgi:hypothetical protein